MAKDPAALIYIDKWVSSTNGMKAEFRAWYFDLLIYQYDKGGIPDDEDELAGICRVRPSEYILFKQMLKQVLKQKFSKNDEGEWINPIATEIISKRKSFKAKRAKSGTIGAILKKARAFSGYQELHFEALKMTLYKMEPEELEKYKQENLLKQMLKQIAKLYINVDVNEDVDVDININIEKGGVGEKTSQQLIDLEVLKKEVRNEFTWKETLVRNLKEVDPSFDMEAVENYLEIFFKTISNDGEEEKTIKDLKKHFSRWLNIQIDKKLKLKNHGKTDKTNQEIFESAMGSEIGRNFKFK